MSAVKDVVVALRTIECMLTMRSVIALAVDLRATRAHTWGGPPYRLSVERSLRLLLCSEEKDAASLVGACTVCWPATQVPVSHTKPSYSCFFGW